MLTVKLLIEPASYLSGILWNKVRNFTFNVFATMLNSTYHQAQDVDLRKWDITLHTPQTTSGDACIRLVRTFTLIP